MPPNRNKYRYGHGDRYRNARKTGIGTDAVTGIDIAIGMCVFRASVAYCRGIGKVISI